MFNRLAVVTTRLEGKRGALPDHSSRRFCRSKGARTACRFIKKSDVSSLDKGAACIAHIGGLPGPARFTFTVLQNLTSRAATLAAI
eukprot:6025370-Prymnesium_polylepis.1